MIRVTVDFIPHGIEHHKERIGILELENDLQHPERPEYGSYIARFAIQRKGSTVGLHSRYVPHFHRVKWNVWGLIGAAIERLADDVRGMPDDSALMNGEWHDS